MRYALIGLMMAATAATASQASVNVSIGINIPTYPRFVAVPGSAVYYSPVVDANYFFYDGLYWVFDDDQWLSSSWYNGPWRSVGPEYVPVYLWQVPVRYYRRPPAYFHSWRRDSAPRWGDHWGADWRSHHDGWDRRDHHVRHTPAPLPHYQRQYTGNRYPQLDQQSQIHSQNYRYQPRDQSVREQYRQQAMPRQQQVQQQLVQQAQQPMQQQAVNPAQRGERSQPQGRGDGNQGRGDGNQGRGDGNRGQNEGRGRDR